MDTTTKIPLHYQMSEYDCGPTSMLNALNYLFCREELTPDVIRNIMLYCLDCYNAEGIPGKLGTSTAAMMFLSNWLNGYGRTGYLKVSSRYLTGKCVFLGAESLINDALKRGGAAVVRLYYDEPHYVLLTGTEEQGGSGAVLRRVRLFDPYFVNRPFPEADVELVLDHPFAYNRIVPEYYFNRETFDMYALGPYDGREAVLLFNEETKATPEKTIEYFI